MTKNFSNFSLTSLLDPMVGRILNSLQKFEKTLSDYYFDCVSPCECYESSCYLLFPYLLAVTLQIKISSSLVAFLSGKKGDVVIGNLSKTQEYLVVESF